MKKWLFPIVLLLCLLTLLAACSPKASSADTSKTAEKDFKGQSITLLIHPTLYLAAGGDNGIIKEFEAMTGATVEVVQAVSPEHTEKAMLDFISKTGAYDVINIGASELSNEFCSNFVPLDNYISANPGYDFNDFIDSLVSVGKYKEKIIGIPYRTAQLLTYYRSDLFAEKGIKAPSDWREVYDAAKAMQKVVNGKTEIYGFAAAGKAPAELAHAWLNPFYGFGGEFVRQDGRSGFNSEAGIKAAELWAKLYKDGIFPADFFAWGRDDMINAMSQGRLAFGHYTASYYGNFFKDSLKPEQVGFSPLPNNKNRSNGWYLAINQYSKNPDLAWELIMALTNKENSLREATLWSNSPARASTYESAEYRTLWPQADDMLIATANAVSEPPSKNAAKMFEAISEEVTYVMQGTKNAERGMADLAARIDKLLGF